MMQSQQAAQTDTQAKRVETEVTCAAVKLPRRIIRRLAFSKNASMRRNKYRQKLFKSTRRK